MRAGAQTLTLLGAPRTSLILRSLAESPKGQLELRRDAGSPAQSTLRGHLAMLETEQAIQRERQDAFPGALVYELTDAGRELLDVADCVDRWLSQAPSPLELGTDSAKATLKGLADGWSVGIVPSLAKCPLSLTELDRAIPAIGYPTIERSLQTMRLSDLLTVGERDSKGTPYALTDWLRRGLAPLAVSARWEWRHRPDRASAICRADIADAIWIGEPLFGLKEDLSGVCQLAVRLLDGGKGERALAFLELHRGRLHFGTVYPRTKPDAWVSADAEIWFATLIDSDASGLRLSGDKALARAVVDGVHQALFASERVKS